MKAKKLLAPIVLGFAIVGVAYLGSQTRMARLANLAVPAGSWPEVYVQMDLGERDQGDRQKCLVTSRAGTTLKRSDSRLAKASWRCRVEGTEIRPVIVADAKNEPSALFVPVTAVVDPALALLYELVRAADEPPWPALRWVHLYYNRQFRGLYLQAFLPGRAFAAEQGIGQTELLAAGADRLACFDRKMRRSCPIYNGAVADGVFPEPRETDASRFLASLTPGGFRAFVITEDDYTRLEPFPLPVDLGQQLDAGATEHENVYHDERYHRWLEVAPPDDAAVERYRQRARAERDELAAALAALVESLEASCVALECDAAAERRRLEGSPADRWLDDTLTGGEG